MRRPAIALPGGGARRTFVEGVNAFAMSGRAGQRVTLILIFDDDGYLIEGFVRTDYRSFLRQPGAPGK